MITFRAILKEEFDRELNNFRLSALKTIKRESKFLQSICLEVIGQHATVQAIGSVIDKNRFKESSDIDVAFIINDDSLPEGMLSDLSETLQNVIIARGVCFDFGYPNTLVYNKSINFKGTKQ